MSWFDSAACKGLPAVVFFPEEGGSLAPARRICAACPVRAECLEHALEHHERGVWGGMSAKERNQRRPVQVEQPAERCFHDHPLNEQNLYIDPRGRRRCRRCGAEANRRRAEKEAS